MSQKLTIAGLIDFVCSQDPAKLVDDTAWSTCAVADYAKSQGVDADWGSFMEPENWPEFRAFVFNTLFPNPAVHGCFNAEFVGDIRQQRTYGDLQRELIEAKLVADPRGG